MIDNRHRLIHLKELSTLRDIDDCSGGCMTCPYFITKYTGTCNRPRPSKIRSDYLRALLEKLDD